MRKFCISVSLLFAVICPAQEKLYKRTTPLNIPRQMYGSVVSGDYLYMLGGYREGGYTRSVQKASIRSDATIGRWNETTNLPQPRSYITNSTLSVNGIVYIVAGYDGSEDVNLNTIIHSKPMPDGHLSPWIESAPFPGGGICCSVAVATPGYIHLIAGTVGDRDPTVLVWSARLGRDGSVVSWEKGPDLPVPLWYHCGVAAGNQVWIWGGLKESSPTSVNEKVYSSPILPSGRLGPWEENSVSLPKAFYSCPSRLSGSYLLSFCPRYSGAVASNDIWYSFLKPDGLMPWKKIPSDLPTKLYIAAARDTRRGVIFIPGGRITKDINDLDGVVYYFPMLGGGQNVSSEEPPATPPVETSRVMAPPAPARETTIYQTGYSYPGFIPFEEFQSMTLSEQKALVLYFHCDTEEQCCSQAKILSAFVPMIYRDKVILSEVNIARFPVLVNQYQVASTPCWVFIDTRGIIQLRKTGVIKLEELDHNIRQIVP